MKKLQLLVFILACVLGSKAQTKTDSSKNIRLSAVIIEMHGILTSNTANNNQADFQKYVQNNELLNKDLSTFSQNVGSTSTDFSGMFSGRIFFEFQKVKRFNLETFIGVRFGSDVLATATYFKSESNTVAKYVNPANNDSLIEVATFNTSYHYQINSQRLFIPLGINISSNKTKRLWFSVGVELSPGITFNNNFGAFYMLTKTTSIYDPSTSKPVNNYSSGSYETLDSKSSQTRLKGIGFESYMALPLSMNLRLSKKIKFLKHLNLNSALAPGVLVVKNKFAGAKTNFITNASLGLRYNW